MRWNERRWRKETVERYALLVQGPRPPHRDLSASAAAEHRPKGGQDRNSVALGVSFWLQRPQLPYRTNKADCTLRSSQAVPHPSTNRALRRLTSEVRRDPVHSTRYGRVCAVNYYASVNIFSKQQIAVNGDDKM